MKLIYKILLFFFILFSINSKVYSYSHQSKITQNKIESGAVNAVCIVHSIVLITGEGIVQPVIRVNEVAPNTYRIVKLFWKVNSSYFFNKHNLHSILRNTQSHLFLQTFIPHYIFFRTLII